MASSTLSLKSSRSTADSVDNMVYTSPFDDSEEKVEKTEKNVFANIEESTQSFLKSRVSSQTLSVEDEDEDNHEDEDKDEGEDEGENKDPGKDENESANEHRNEVKTFLLSSQVPCSLSQKMHSLRNA